jgi:hypothetical protein
MKLKEAFDRLRFTLSKQNKPNQTDIEAFNEIGKYFALHQKDIIQDNLLFAKLYAFTLSELLTYYSDVDFANKELNRILSDPMQLRVNILQLKLKNMEYRNFFSRKGILDPFLKTKTVKELEAIHERYLDKLPQLDPIEFAKVGNNWDKESVIYNLESNINLSIQNFKNNV